MLAESSCLQHDCQEKKIVPEELADFPRRVGIDELLLGEENRKLPSRSSKDRRGSPGAGCLLALGRAHFA